MNINFIEDDYMKDYVYESEELTKAGEALDLKLVQILPDEQHVIILRLYFNHGATTTCSEAVLDAWTDAPYGNAPSLIFSGN